MSDWPTKTVEELQRAGILRVEDGNHGEYRPRPSEFAEDGVAFIRAADMSSGTVDFRGASKINEVARARIRKGIGRDEDTLLSHKGTVGKVAFVPKGSPSFVCSPQTTFWRATSTDDLDPGYLRYYLQSPIFRQFLASRSAETDMAPYVSLTAQRTFAVVLPPIDEQRAIAATLGALDEKIESNHQTSSRLFDLAAGLLSTGPELIRVGDIADVSKGLSYKGSGLDDGTSIGARPMLSLANFGTSGTPKLESLKYYTGESKPKHRLSTWELVLANTDLTQRREILGRGILVPPTLNGALHTHHTSVVRFHKRADLALLLWAQLQGRSFRDRAKGFATGTTVTALPTEAILDFKISVPVETLGPLSAAKDMIQLAWHLQVESVSLVELRDTLLPTMLSGRVRVADAARFTNSEAVERVGKI